MILRIFLSFCVFILFYFSALAQTYIVNTNVLDVEQKKLLTGQTVVVKKDKIIIVTSSKKINTGEGIRLFILSI